MRYQEILSEMSSIYSDKISVLVITATDIETTEVINNLLPFPNEKKILQLSNNNQTYYLGLLGIYGVAVVQSEMGAAGRNSSLITTLRAIELWSPKAVIMVGIAFGIDLQKQQIGDVIVSSHIIPYENARIGTNRVYRSELPPASTLLLNRIKQIRDWKFLVSRSSYAKLYVGPILTGEKLIDSKKFKDDLIGTFPNAIGGEMESAGVYVAANEKRVDWVIIKGICDFADGDKSKNKDEYQAIAIKSAVNFTKRVLNIKFGFNELGFKPLIESEQLEPSNNDATLLKDLLALFDLIEQKSEQNTSNVFKVVARQIVQTETDTRFSLEATRLQMLIPDYVLKSFERRIEVCWNGYNEVLASDDGYLPSEIDNATNALKRCICRELDRLLSVNGAIPNGQMTDYWDKYKCGTNQ